MSEDAERYRTGWVPDRSPLAIRMKALELVDVIGELIDLARIPEADRAILSEASAIGAVVAADQLAAIRAEKEAAGSRDSGGGHD